LYASELPIIKFLERWQKKKFLKSVGIAAGFVLEIFCYLKTKRFYKQIALMCGNLA
jgi:hypothetical protein